MQISGRRTDKSRFVDQSKETNGQMDFVICHVDRHGEWIPSLYNSPAKTRS
jgi:hypothetical protein